MSAEDGEYSACFSLQSVWECVESKTTRNLIMFMIVVCNNIHIFSNTETWPHFQTYDSTMSSDGYGSYYSGLAFPKPKLCSIYALRVISQPFCVGCSSSTQLQLLLSTPSLLWFILSVIGVAGVGVHWSSLSISCPQLASRRVL